ncbi:MAG: hypothetical protein NTV61_04100 [Candidatus Bathyarchaeota archaeon]|nr:hypothetical protein [Candidatus Bathyarchaeota archaeon]
MQFPQAARIMIKSIHNSIGNQTNTSISEPKKSKKWLIIILLIIVAAVLSVSAYILMNQAPKSWSPKVGDFVVYSTAISGINGTWRIQVESISTKDITLKMTQRSLFGENITTTVVPLNSTLGIEISSMTQWPKMTLVKKVTESVSTKWGSKTAEHSTYTVNQSGTTMTMDFWIVNRVMVKWTNHIMGDMGILGILDITLTANLTDTNVSSIIG